MFATRAAKIVDVVLPKSRLLNQLLVEIVIAEAPVVNVKLHAVVADKLVVVNVLVIDESD